jgi:hypothetical protein
MDSSLLNHRYRVLWVLGEGGFGKTFRYQVTSNLKESSDRTEVH